MYKRPKVQNIAKNPNSRNDILNKQRDYGAQTMQSDGLSSMLPSMATASNKKHETDKI